MFTSPTSTDSKHSTDPKGHTADETPNEDKKTNRSSAKQPDPSATGADDKQRDKPSPEEALRDQEPRQNIDGQTSDGTQINAFRSDADEAVKAAHEAIDKLADAANKVADKATQ